MNWNKRSIIYWTLIAVSWAVAISSLVYGHKDKPVTVADTYPANGPSSVFGQTLAPEPEPCPEHVEASFMGQFVDYLDNQAVNPREVHDVMQNCWWETRYNHDTVSDTDDWGICGINKRANPDVDTSRLLIDAQYAAIVCLDTYRVFYKACGEDWRCCYRRGVRGCRNWIAAQGD